MTTPAMPTPAGAWEQLQQGNACFAAGTSTHPRQDPPRRAELAFEQHPFAGIIGCGDSRAAIEELFDLGLGDAFVVRNAGHVISESALGSLEYAVGPLQVPLLVVLAHERCGAVRAAIDAQAAGAEPLPPHIAATIAPITPAVRGVAGVAEGGSVDTDALDAAEVGRAHVRNSITAILEGSEMTAAAIAEGKLAIVGAYYRLVEGTVETVVTVGLD